MSKKYNLEQNFNTKVLNMVDYLNCYYNDNYNEEDINDLAIFYRGLFKSGDNHKKMTSIIRALYIELNIIEAQEKTEEEIVNKIEYLNEKLINLELGKIKKNCDINKKIKYLNNEILKAKQELVLVKHFDELYDLCTSFRRFPNKYVESAYVLKGDLVCVYDNRNQPAYYIPSCKAKNFEYDGFCYTLSDMEEFYKEYKEEQKRLILEREAHDKY